MKFESLCITNLRAIRYFEISDLGNFVVIAGQNGSGKSCVFDAIRLLKSVYGGHAANEYQHWFGEFGVNIQDGASLKKLFRASESPIKIEAKVAFHETERAFLESNIERLAQPMAWVRVTGQPVDFWSFNPMAYLAQMRTIRPQLDAMTEVIATEIRNALADPFHQLSLTISPKGELFIANCRPVEAAFQAYEPRNLGLIEYHSASRSYSRQQVGGINLDARAFEDQARQSRLYNWQNKYQNVKTELASSYIRSLISGQAGGGEDASGLDSTLQELFHTFSPDKIYEGVHPQPGGNLGFPVRLSTGERHDIDELSSGEKEILYGFLKLKNSTPRNSVILLDEPELHLHPSLLEGFTDFYYRRLGLEQDNQLWLVTHSDTLLRQAVGNSNYRVIQMIPATSPEAPTNQAVEVVADEDVDKATIVLVGDLAAYRPHGKVVILEGDHEDGFDVQMVRRLFPDFGRRVNLVSGGNKGRVAGLHKALQKAASSAGLKNRFFAILDKDADPPLTTDPATTIFTWDVYHIENYLLHPAAIRAACVALAGHDPFSTDSKVYEALLYCARNLVDRLVQEKLIREVNGHMIEALKIGGDPRSKAPQLAIAASLKHSMERVREVSSMLTDRYLADQAETYRANIKTALDDGTWSTEFPGREILGQFANQALKLKVSGDIFRNTVLDKMVELSIRPEGMETIVDKIASRSYFFND
ncbi:MAG: hypothetical protein QOF73_523 [Thermomicrobiales bacterium]|nr:hypothetical protein [Thermomicrobiales bacterium]